MIASYEYNAYKMIYIKRTLLIFVLFFYLIRWYSYLLPYQIAALPLAKVEYNVGAILYRYFNLDDVLNSFGAINIVWSISLVLIPLYLFKKPNNLFFGFIFITNNLLYHFYYTTHLTHAYHYLVGIIVLSSIFFINKEKTFNFYWYGLRFWICIAYCSAFLWKFFNGAFFQFDYGEAVFKKNLATYMYLNPDSYMTSIYYYFLQHPLLLNLGTYACFFMEGIMVLGLLTKKYDKYLILNILLLHHLLYLFVDTLFIEWYIFILPFFTPAFWNKLEYQTKKIASKINLKASNY